MKSILKAMRSSLSLGPHPRITALKSLQQEEHGDPFKILIGTILSARTRDENTTKVVNRLFSRFKDSRALASADIGEVKLLIRSIGFYNVKAARIKRVAQIVEEKFGGTVPSDIEELLELPGVGRKTANCVLVYGFGKSAIPVDVHVHRIANRLGIVSTKKPEHTEAALEKIVDRKLWLDVNDTFVMYGQNICLPRNPRCHLCKLSRSCEFFSSRHPFSS